ncbi:MAG: heavy metal-binding domain-containing protein [Saprospiraceae bacterium]|nr:heavy metal-binding domain-containing protein [Saprospiraceae bacterium]
MKKSVFYLIFLPAVLGFLPSCSSQKPAAGLLKDDIQRKAIIAAIVQHHPYRMEMMKEMMNSDSCKEMMGHGMMKDPVMMKKMMEEMMTMAEKDSMMCKEMMQMMDTKPMMKKRMKEMNMPTGMIYTCPMHPEIQTATPGKCPKCGMDLVKKSAKKND